MLGIIVISGCTSSSDSNTSESDVIPALSCEAQYNALIKDIESSNYCSGSKKCFSLPLMGRKAFTDLDLPECYYFVSSDASGNYVSLDVLDYKITSFMSRCKDVFDEFTDKCSPHPQVVCSEGKCASYLNK